MSFFLFLPKWKLLSHVQLFGTPWTIWFMEFSCQNSGVGNLSLLQELFPTQRLNPGLPHCRQILYQLSRKGSPRILEWVAYSFSSGSSCTRNWTGVSCIAGGFFTNWAFREDPLAFFMIQQMLAIWSLVPLPLQNPACTSGSSQFVRTFRGAKGLVLHYRMPKDKVNKQVIKVLIYYFVTLK